MLSRPSGLSEGSGVMLGFRKTTNGFYVQSRDRVGVVEVLQAKSSVPIEIAVKTSSFDGCSSQ